jgi:hypothetical protein
MMLASFAGQKMSVEETLRKGETISGIAFL